ncbi:MAG: MFS transporter [Dehalococcoidia bacterium]
MQHRRALQRLSGRVVLLIALASVGMVGLGLPDGMQGVAWPSMSGFFRVPLPFLGILLAVYTSGYIGTSFNSGRILRRFPPGVLLTASATLMGLSLLGFALAPSWWVLLGAALLVGSGSGGVDAGLNVYAATRFSARVTNWMHAFYGLGAAIGPGIMTGLLVAGWRWQWGYAIASAVLLLIALGYGLTRNRWQLQDRDSTGSAQPVVPASSMMTLRQPAALLSIGVFVLYTGLEVTAGQWAFTLLTQGRGVDTATAGTWVGMYYAALTLGRIGLGAMANVIPARRLLRMAIAASVLGAGMFWLDVTPWLSFAGIAILGLSFGPIFPSLIATTRSRIGKSHTPNAIGFQVAAAALGAVLAPGAVGIIAGATSLEAISVSVLIGTIVLFALYRTLELRPAPVGA